MIMPADPQVGDVYHPENIPDLVYETVTVLETDQSVDGPRGSVDGAIRTEEVLMDGAIEHKTFAPGYGEFGAEAEDELVTVAIAVPIDAGTHAAVSTPRWSSPSCRGISSTIRMIPMRPWP